MGDFNKKELETIDSIVDLINVEIFSIEQSETDKGKLDYSLCLNDYEEQEITEKKIKNFKAKIEKCSLEIAPYLHELIEPSLKDYSLYGLIDKMSKEFIISYYLELIEVLAKEEGFDFYQYSFSSVVKSKGYKYKPLKNYIQGVCNVIHYIKYKHILDDINQNEPNKLEKKTSSILPEKIEIVYLDNIYYKNLDILPESIKKAYNQIGTFKTLYITELKDKSIKNIYQDDLDHFESIDDKILIEYYCIESNYLNFLSRIKDEYLVFFDVNSIDYLFYEYAKAFVTAYSEFETILNKNQNLIEDTRKQRALKVFSYVLNAEYRNGYFGDAFDNLEQFKNRKGRIISNTELYEWGYNGGQFYKAWEIILNNPLIFEPLFLKFNAVSNINDSNVVVDNSINDHLKSTIEDYLEEFKEFIKGNGYEVLVNALFEYFKNGVFPKLTSKINFKTINKKRVGWELKELYKSEKTDIIDVNYILFAKDNINLFENEIYEEHNFRASKLYKIFTTNPAK